MLVSKYNCHMSKVAIGLMGPSAASHVLGASAKTVVNWAKRGLLPAIRTAEGRHLFELSELEQVARQRQASREEREP